MLKPASLFRMLMVACFVFSFAAFQPAGVQAAAPGWIVTCQYSHSAQDDPIVFPGKPGAAHMHDFAGARSTDAFSTAASLRAGGTTCAIAGDTSSYWVPALYEDGRRVLPDATSANALFYYRRKGAPTGTNVQPFPMGLRIIIGNAHAKSPQENPQLGSDIVFKCGPGSGTNLPAPPTSCSSGILVLSLRFPNCWDGKNLDSADHKSHMAYPRSGKCPASHPVVLPRLESFFRYNVGTGPIGNITLSSGPYYTAHQDFFNAWDPIALQNLVTKCLNAMVDCGKNPSTTTTQTSSSTAMTLPTATLRPTMTALPANTQASMPTQVPLPTNTAMPMPTDTPVQVQETPTESIPPTETTPHVH